MEKTMDKGKWFGRGKKAFASIGVATGALAALASGASAAPLDFTGQDLGLDVNDVISTGFNFMTMFGPYTMLILGVIFAPVAIGFVIWLLKKIPKFSK